MMLSRFFLLIWMLAGVVSLNLAFSPQQSSTLRPAPHPVQSSSRDASRQSSPTKRDYQNAILTIATRHRTTSKDWQSRLHASSNLNEEGKCKFGQKSYWDAMYNGTGDRPSEAYSWYCGYEELKPFWNMLASRPLLGHNKASTRVLVAGIGNDVTPVDMYDDGWTNMIAFDYSKSAVQRATDLFGNTRQNVTLLTADARYLPLPSNHCNAILDKGTLDAIYITGIEVFRDAVEELTRVTADGGVFVCVSTVIPSDQLMAAFASGLWENLLNGELAFASEGEATIDLGAELYCWRKVSARMN